MYSYVLYYNIEKSGFNAVSASLVSKFRNLYEHFYAPEIEDRGAYCFCPVFHSVIPLFSLKH